MTMSTKQANGGAMRQAMIDSQLRPSAVSDPRVIAAMAAVAREDFVPADYADVAYADFAVPLNGARALNPPIATGRLLTEAAIRPSDRVLLIGAATGYTAAVLARLAASAVAVESDHALMADAQKALGGVAGVMLAEGDLASGWAANAPYDVIVIDGAVERVPEALVSQLADGGRLVAGVIDRGVCRLSLGKRSAGAFAMIGFADSDAAPLPGFAPKPEFVF